MKTATTTPGSTAALYDSFVLGNYAPAPITIVRGRGCKVWDDGGKAYLDFTTGIAVSNLGHCHPAWVRAVRRQAGTLVHTSNLFRNPNQGELARRLVAAIGPGRAFFCNSGTEANEALIKLARLHGVQKAGGVEGRCHKIIVAKNAFHGRTFGGMSATPQEKIQKGFAPLLPGFAAATLNDLAGFEALVDGQTCAILVEPIQGESGVHACTPEFMAGLRALCDRHNLLLMFDEVQCGIGRTGRMFAFEGMGVRPDAVSMAKGLGGGFPIGAMWAGEKHAGLFHPGSHGSTFGGTALACAAALAVLDVIEKEKLLERVNKLSPAWIEGLNRLAKDVPSVVTAVRGHGYLVALQCASDPAPWVAKLREAGLLALTAGGNAMRLLPPLNVTKAALDRSLRILRKVLIS